MPRSLPPIPSYAPVTDAQGLITTFFRLLWQLLIAGWAMVPTAGNSDLTTIDESINTTTILTPTSAGFVRVTYYLRKTVADGTSSSLTMTVGWTQGGTALTFSFSALTTDTTSANQEGAITVYADAGTAVTYAVAYASNTAAKMKYDAHVAAEQVVNS